jgi:hypothetical protein
MSGKTRTFSMIGRAKAFYKNEGLVYIPVNLSKTKEK